MRPRGIAIVGLGFTLRLRFGSRCRLWTLHPTRIEAHARSRLARRAGRRWSPRPRSSSGPLCRPPHDVDLVGPLSPGSGKGQSRVSRACRALGVSGEEAGTDVQSSAAGCRTFGLTIGAFLCSEHLGTSRSLRVRSSWLPLDGGLARPALPQCTVWMNRSASNAFSRSST